MNEIITLPSRIGVTDIHIAAGKARSCTDCPVALAVLDAILDALRAAGIPADSSDITVIAWREDITVWIGWDAWQAGAPEVVDGFIYRFDHRGYVEPFSFDVTWRRLTGPLEERQASC